MPETKQSKRGISPKQVSNIKVVVLCVAAATTFWILNALNKEDYTTIVDYPIEFEFDQEQFMAVKPLPSSIEIEINGNGWDLLQKYFQVNVQPFLVELDRPAANDYLLTADVRSSLSEFISPTQLLNLGTDSLKFQIDPIRTIKLTPTLDSTSYSLGKNIRMLSNPTFEPNTITLKGPSSILDLYEGKFPISLDENRIDQNISKNIPLKISKELAEFVTLETEEIKIELEVVAFLEGNKRLKLKKVNFPRSVNLEEEEPIVMMYYLVDERKTDQLKDLEFEAVLNYSRRNKEDSTISIQVSPLPEFLDQVRVEPSSFKLIYGN